MTESTPETFLPLTPLTFGILTAVASGPKSGYGIVRGIEEGSHGRLSPGTGTVYVALQRLMDQGLLAPADAPADAPDDNRQRRWYALTPLGKRTVVLEARRLAGALRLAAEAGILVDEEVMDP